MTARLKTLRFYPEGERFQGVSNEARAVVSEPLREPPGLWRELPPSPALIVHPGADDEWRSPRVRP
jgi:hypothetical protein